MHVPRFSWRPRWFIDDTVLKREGDRGQGRKLTYKALELGSNNFSVTLVAARTATAPVTGTRSSANAQCVQLGSLQAHTCYILRTTRFPCLDTFTGVTRQNLLMRPISLKRLPQGVLLG